MPLELNYNDRSPGDLLQYPRFDEREVVLRWHKDWWDGPLNGSILYGAQRYWFDFYCDAEENGNPYYYLVYPLTDEEADVADSWSAENERFRIEWKPLANDPTTKSLPTTAELTARWKTHEMRLTDYSNRQPVAWFECGSNSSFYAI